MGREKYGQSGRMAGVEVFVPFALMGRTHQSSAGRGVTLWPQEWYDDVLNVHGLCFDRASCLKTHLSSAEPTILGSECLVSTLHARDTT